MRRTGMIFSVVILLGTVLWSLTQPEYPPELRRKLRVPAGMVPNQGLERFEDVAQNLPNAAVYELFRNENGAWRFLVDTRGSVPGFMDGMGIPWIPGTGVGNDLTMVDLAPYTAGPVTEVTADILEARAREFLQRWRSLYGIDPVDLVLNRRGTVRVNPNLWFVQFDYAPYGVPVEGAVFSFTAGHGNLIQVGQPWVVPSGGEPGRERRGGAA